MIGTSYTGQRGMGIGLQLFPIALMVHICLGSNLQIILASDMG